MANTNSIMDSAMAAAGTRAWILRAIYDTLTAGEDVTYALRNVRAEGIRSAVKSIVGDAVKVPTKRDLAIAMAIKVVYHLREDGVVKPEQL